jgi:hypothetical protein
MVRHSLVVAAVALAGAALSASCDETTGFPDAGPPDATPLPGTISLTWSIDGGQTCADLGASGMVLGIRLTDSPVGEPDSYSCDSLMGTTGPLTPGSYVLTFDLVFGANTLASAPTQTDVIVTAGQNTDIGNIVFTPE